MPGRGVPYVLAMSLFSRNSVQSNRLLALIILLLFCAGDRVRYEEARGVDGRVHLVHTPENSVVCVAREAARERLEAWHRGNVSGRGAEQCTPLPSGVAGHGRSILGRGDGHGIGRSQPHLPTEEGMCRLYYCVLE